MDAPFEEYKYGNPLLERNAERRPVLLPNVRRLNHGVSEKGLNGYHQKPHAATRLRVFPVQVCGDPEAWGDGVVPEPSAHLEGALNITLDGVYHSPVGVDDGAENGSSKRRVWYGSPGVLEKWVHHLLE